MPVIKIKKEDLNEKAWEEVKRKMYQKIYSNDKETSKKDLQIVE